ncbi:Mediator of DNA damage checkpoint protein 1, partial [Eudyptes moseleyi]
MEPPDTDVEGSQEEHQMLVVDSDTDVEEGGADPDVGYPKAHPTTPNVPKPRIIEVETQNADVEGSEEGRRMLVVDSDTDVEEGGADPDVGYPKAHPTTPNVPKPRIIEVEAQNADVEGSEEGREGPRRSQRLARSRGGGASGRGGASGVKGGVPPVPAPVRRSPRLQARPPPLEPPAVRGRGQVEPCPPPRPRPRRTGPAPSKKQAQVGVLFTGVVASPGMEVALKTLGGSMATSVFDCTHLVTDRVRRTVKFLCAVARGVPVVTPEWLHESARSGRVLVPGPFLVRDSQQERHFGFSLAEALRRARRHPLLQGYEVHVTPNVRPEPEHMRDIVTCSGGTFLPTMPRTYGVRGQHGG